MPSPQTPVIVGAAGTRRSKPDGHNPIGRGGVGHVVRRGVDPTLAHALTTPGGVASLAVGNALRLLKLLPDVHPMVDKELWNVLQLACAPGDLQILAVVDGPNGEEIDAEGTASLDALWKSLPPEIGGLYGLQRMLTQEATLTGLAFVETVPGRSGEGVFEIWVVDSLSILFERDDTGHLSPMQRQANAPPSANRNGYVPLSKDLCFWRAVNPMVDEPYGRAPFGVALNECLRDIAMLKDLHDAIHLTGSPRIAQGFDFKEMILFARQQGMDAKEATDWAWSQFQKARDVAGTLRSDDVLMHDKNAEVKLLSAPGAFAGLEPVLVFLRERITMALKTMPMLLGVTDSSTETYADKAWEIYAAGLESIRGYVAEIIYGIAGLHLRLQGRPSRPKVKTQKIRTTDALAEATTLRAKIANERELIDMGFKDPEQSSKDLTGSAPFDPVRAARITARPATEGTIATTTQATKAVSFKRGGKPAKAARAA